MSKRKLVIVSIVILVIQISDVRLTKKGNRMMNVVIWLAIINLMIHKETSAINTYIQTKWGRMEMHQNYKEPCPKMYEELTWANIHMLKLPDRRWSNYLIEYFPLIILSVQPGLIWNGIQKEINITLEIWKRLQ